MSLLAGWLYVLSRTTFVSKCHFAALKIWARNKIHSENGHKVNFDDELCKEMEGFVLKSLKKAMNVLFPVSRLAFNVVQRWFYASLYIILLSYSYLYVLN